MFVVAQRAFVLRCLRLSRTLERSPTAATAETVNSPRKQRDEFPSRTPSHRVFFPESGLLSRSLVRAFTPRAFFADARFVAPFADALFVAQRGGAIDNNGWMKFLHKSLALFRGNHNYDSGRSGGQVTARAPMGFAPFLCPNDGTHGSPSSVAELSGILLSLKSNPSCVLLLHVPDITTAWSSY